MELKPRDLLPFPIFLSPRGFGVSFSQIFLGSTPNPGARTLPPPSEPRNAQKFHKNANFPKVFLIFRTQRFLCSALPILSREILALNEIFLLFYLHKKSFSLLFLHFPFSPPFLPFFHLFLSFPSIPLLFPPIFLSFCSFSSSFSSFFPSLFSYSPNHSRPQTPEIPKPDFPRYFPGARSRNVRSQTIKNPASI